MASRWARLATSGTTPPNRACSSTLLAIASKRRVPPRTRPTPVSSQLVSMPSTRGSLIFDQLLAQDEGVDRSRATGRAVVAGPGPHRPVAAAEVEPERGGVVGPHLQ